MGSLPDLKTLGPKSLGAAVRRPKLMAACWQTLNAPDPRGELSNAKTILSALKDADEREAIYDAAAAADTTPDRLQAIDALKANVRKKIGPNRLTSKLVEWELELPPHMPQAQRVEEFYNRLSALDQELTA